MPGLDHRARKARVAPRAARPSVRAGVATRPAITVRPLVPADLRQVVRIDAGHRGSAQPAYWKRVFKEFLGARRRRGRVGVAADVDGRLAGFLLGDVRAFEFGSEPCGWILDVGVDPLHARRGVASALLDAACRHLRAAGVVTIRTMVTRDDVPVLTFFRTNGFVGGPFVQLELPGQPRE